MQYFDIQFDCGTELLQEVYDGQVLRYCDMAGNTVDPPSGGNRVVSEVTPSFTPPPDPVPVIDATVAPAPTPAPAIAPVAEQASIVGAPIRQLSYDTIGQLVRIDYPTMGKYQMLEYANGRLSKITEINSDGVQFVRYWYYDDFGRPQEETQP